MARYTCFFINAFGRRSQSDTIYSVNLRTCAHALRMHYAPKLRTLNVLQIANYKMGNYICLYPFPIFTGYTFQFVGRFGLY